MITQELDLEQFKGHTPPKREHKIVYLGAPHPEEGNTDKWSCIQTDTFAYDLMFAASVSDEDIKKVTNLCAAAPKLLSELSACRERVKELEAALLSIKSIQEDSGMEGCRYGDTKYDSLSVVYGWNKCLEWVKSICNKPLSNGTK